MRSNVHGVRSLFENRDQLMNGVLILERMPKWPIVDDPISIATTHSLAAHVAAVLEFVNASPARLAFSVVSFCLFASVVPFNLVVRANAVRASAARDRAPVIASLAV